MTPTEDAALTFKGICEHDGEPCGDEVCCQCGAPYEPRNEGGDPPYLCDPCAQGLVVALHKSLTKTEAELTEAKEQFSAMSQLAREARELLQRWYDEYGHSTNETGSKRCNAKLDADTEAALQGGDTTP